MSSNRKFAILVGAATCLLAVIYAAPIFGADDPLMSTRMEIGGLPAPSAANDVVEDEAMMAPLRQQANAALARLEIAAATPQ